MVTEAMHKSFLDFCSVPVEQLSEEEWALLQVHMVYCPTCRETFESLQPKKERKPGTVETYATVYEPLKPFGIPAQVWDEVLDEMFGLPLGQVPGPMQMIHNTAKANAMVAERLLRKEGMSDREYVRYLLEDANAFWQTLDPIDRDYWEFDLERGISVKRVPGDEPPRRHH
ncbi:hypothetical protein [Terriglobus albidus]|uniref:hypothetical protein n=1 Tax=Terriglobus albidus TaxID=1592106 RepID=UPI0021E0D68D|nr:hypothetical protein [Terriglobus albidus]